MRSFQSAFVAYPILLSLVLLVGCSSMKNEQKIAAKKEWNSARANVLFSLAKDQYATGNFDKSRQTVDEALGMDPQNVNLRILSAKLNIEQGHLESADADLKLARASNPRNAETDYLSGVIYQRWQKPEAAYDYYKAASEKAPSELAYVLARAEMLVTMDKPTEALELLQAKVTFFEHSAAIRDAAGQLLVQQHKYKDAVDMLRQASVLATDDMAIREHLALAMFYAGQYREAADALTRLTKKESYDERADLLAALGECQLQLALYRDARSTFETATRLDPSSAGMWLGHAKAAMQLNDLKRAEGSPEKGPGRGAGEQRSAPDVRLPAAPPKQPGRGAAGVQEGQCARPERHGQPVHGGLRPGKDGQVGPGGPVLQQGAETEAQRRDGFEVHGFGEPG
jgi:predicted Zn-dependent protease